jgi:MFS superfamily sulfate permease-like transporter
MAVLAMFITSPHVVVGPDAAIAGVVGTTIDPFAN